MPEKNRRFPDMVVVCGTEVEEVSGIQGSGLHSGV